MPKIRKIAERKERGATAEELEKLGLKAIDASGVFGGLSPVPANRIVQLEAWVMDLTALARKIIAVDSQDDPQYQLLADLADDLLGVQEVCSPSELVERITQHDLKQRQLIQKLGSIIDNIVEEYAERTPDGTGVCYLQNGELILLGYPRGEDEDHNCDAMGCSSVSHVVERRKLTPEQLERLQRGERVGLSEDDDA